MIYDVNRRHYNWQSMELSGANSAEVGARVAATNNGGLVNGEKSRTGSFAPVRSYLRVKRS
jgi:hypothetical protein